jgi:hypothetical protein
MRLLVLLTLLCVGFFSCKNNGHNTGQAKAADSEKTLITAKEIIIDANRKPVKPDFRLLEMNSQADILTVVVQYSGGCEEHDFNAYFSGGWGKSLPPQAAISLEHLNPIKDNCRSMVKDTLKLNLKPLQYSGSNEVVVKWTVDPEKQAVYRYGK